MKTQEKLFEDFLNGATSGKASNMKIEGETLVTDNINHLGLIAIRQSNKSFYYYKQGAGHRQLPLYVFIVDKYTKDNLTSLQYRAFKFWAKRKNQEMRVAGVGGIELHSAPECDMSLMASHVKTEIELSMKALVNCRTAWNLKSHIKIINDLMDDYYQVRFEHRLPNIHSKLLKIKNKILKPKKIIPKDLKEAKQKLYRSNSLVNKLRKDNAKLKEELELVNRSRSSSILARYVMNSVYDNGEEAAGLS